MSHLARAARAARLGAVAALGAACLLLVGTPLAFATQTTSTPLTSTPLTSTPQDSTSSLDTWADIAAEMTTVLEQSFATFESGDAAAAVDEVDVAYYGYYEKLGFEKVVMAHVSGSAATEAEYEFGLIKKGMAAGDPASEVRAHVDALIGMLADQAAALDGSSDSPWAALGGSLLIIVREGFEAILVVGAIIAYLIKSGNRDKLRTVYAGAGIALAASVLLAVAINAITSLAGANQEIIEGVTILIAVAMLVWVSNWIASKSHAAAWTGYIQSQADASVRRGSAFSLAFVAFLAVFREGAETILLYQALRAGSAGQGAMIWTGLGIGIVLLVGVYLAIRYLAIRIPTGPFFIGTSVLLAVMAVAFTGSGIKELQEGGLITITPVAGMPSVDLLGVYPSAETLAAQGVVLVAVVAGFVLGLRRARRAKVPPTMPPPTSPSTSTSTPSPTSAPTPTPSSSPYPDTQDKQLETTP